MRHLNWEDETGHIALFYTYLNNRRKGKDATKPSTLGLLGHSGLYSLPSVRMITPGQKFPKQKWTNINFSLKQKLSLRGKKDPKTEFPPLYNSKLSPYWCEILFRFWSTFKNSCAQFYSLSEYMYITAAG